MDYARQGLFLPNELVLEILAEAARETAATRGYLLNGFPKTMEFNYVRDD